ncbi:MAG: acetate kinase [Treponema sp.]|nr:acetate kinase [Treponema sp.]MCL2238285.1 acetate kinase [Treponema sp.]
MIILTLNCGSSSAKYQVYNWDTKDVLAVGIVEKVTIGGSFITHKAKGREEVVFNQECPTHTDAIDLIIKTITSKEMGVIGSMSEIQAVGHRVVHGGDKFTKSVIVDDAAMKAFEDMQDLSPLHNPANIMGIVAAKKVLPDVPHCATMDTAWHQTMPPKNFLYAVPLEWYQKYRVRRYGFHGTSFLYTAKRAAVLLGQDPFKTNLVICHIGNGASVNAVKDGLSFDTSMGMTPLEGLVMGTRSGDIDPSLAFYMMRKTGMSANEMETALNKQSGLLGLTGKQTDRRDIQAAAVGGSIRALRAQKIEAHRVRKYIGAYQAVLGRVDALVLTAGVGEFAWFMREKILDGLDGIGMTFDPNKNKISMTRNSETLISKPDSKIPIFVIPTDEELVMTEDAFALMQGTYDTHTHFSYSFQKKDYVNKGRAEGLVHDLVKNPELESIIAKPR